MNEKILQQNCQAFALATLLDAAQILRSNTKQWDTNPIHVLIIIIHRATALTGYHAPPLHTSRSSLKNETKMSSVGPRNAKGQPRWISWKLIMISKVLRRFKSQIRSPINICGRGHPSHFFEIPSSRFGKNHYFADLWVSTSRQF